MAFILGKKLKMSQIWMEDKVVPVTIVKARPNKVSLIRKAENDGYEAVRLDLDNSKVEFRNKNNSFDANKFKIGDKVDVSVFSEGDIVKVSGVSKGKGFQGVVKRYNFGGGPKTHGQKDRLRAPGSIGSTGIQRVVKGRKMAGHTGCERITVKNLKIVKIDSENHQIYIKGAIPGARNGLVEIVRLKKAGAGADNGKKEDKQ